MVKFLTMVVWHDNLTKAETTSFVSAQSKIEKLRPLKDRIYLKVKNVNGFAGCIISDKIKVLCINDKSKKEIQSILYRYKNIEILNVSSPGEQVRSRKNLSPFNHTKYAMIDLRKK